MNIKIILFFVLALILFNSVHSEICDYGENDCLLRRSRAFYKEIVKGIDGVIEPSDPLYRAEIKGKVKLLKFRLTNVILRGLKNCESVKSVLRKASETDTLYYERTLFCPKLVVKYNFESNQLYKPLAIPRIGNSTITATNYLIIFKGKMVKFISKKDNKPHYRIKKNRIETKAKGKLSRVPLFQKKPAVDVKETLDYLETRKGTENYLECPIMRDLMKIFNERSDKYLRTLPIKEVLLK